MTLEGLKCFCAVVESGSFRAAAGLVYRSQPAVSQQIKALERELGHVLIDRRTCAPTAHGHLLHNRAREILRESAAIQREMADQNADAAGELRLGTSDTTAVYLLPPYVRRFAARFPKARLSVTSRNSDAIAAQVTRDELDLGLVTLPQRHPALEEEPVFRQRLRLVAPRAHPLARRERVELGELRDTPMLLLDGQTRTGTLLRAFFQRAGFTPKVVLDSGSFEVIKRYIADGMGVSFLPEAVIASRDRSLAAVAMEGLPEIEIGVIWRRGAYLGRTAREFLALLRKSKGSRDE